MTTLTSQQRQDLIDELPRLKRYCLSLTSDPADADDLFDGVEQIVDDGGAPMAIRLISVVADEDGDPVVHWSRDNSGAAPYAPGAAYDGLPASTLLDSGASIIVGEIDYQYSSKLMRIAVPPISFHGTATRWPRRSIKVQLCISTSSCTS